MVSGKGEPMIDKEMKWTVFGERLSKELEKKQLSYRQFAERTGMTTTTVCRYAKCERVPRASEIIKTAEALGVTCDYLLGLSDDPHKTSMSYVIAQPEQPWILCDEKMPEEHEWIGTKKFGTTISDEVYVTFENEKGERFCRHMKFQNGELSRYDQFHMDTWFKGSKPIAWMPLPVPYQRGGEEDVRKPD